MEGYKHFSHAHNLVVYQMPEGCEEITCSGCCNSMRNGRAYMCRICNFYLHDQCFQASRSLRHPSHPPHPLTLLPYPTYPSNSFFCDSCKLSGTGFSYTCSDCDFDLHVQCAYSIPYSTTPHPFSSLYSLLNNSRPNHAPDAYPPPHSSPIHHSTLTYQAIPYQYIPHQPRMQETLPSQISSATERVSALEVPPVIMGHDHSSEIGKEKAKPQGIMHFSHPHALQLLQGQPDKPKTCTACEAQIPGSGHFCTESNCSFNLHQSCFELKPQIQHRSHPDHSLTLVSSPHYKELNGDGFACNACLYGSNTAFSYNCFTCRFDLHIKCASLPETVRREDHEHPLHLLYSCPFKGAEYRFVCGVCFEVVHKDSWGYYCVECKVGTHMDCVKDEVKKREASSEIEQLLEAQIQLQNLELLSQMNQQTANMTLHMAQQSANMGNSICDSI